MHFSNINYAKLLQKCRIVVIQAVSRKGTFMDQKKCHLIPMSKKLDTIISTSIPVRYSCLLLLTVVFSLFSPHSSKADSLSTDRYNAQPSLTRGTEVAPSKSGVTLCTGKQRIINLSTTLTDAQCYKKIEKYLVESNCVPTLTTNTGTIPSLITKNVSIEQMFTQCGLLGGWCGPEDMVLIDDDGTIIRIPL